MSARWLHPDDHDALEELLFHAPVPNLFLIGITDAPATGAVWGGVFEGDRLLGAAMALDTLVVPTPTLGDPHPTGVALGNLLATRVEPGLLVGPRAACDAIASRFPPARGWFDQRLYTCTSAPDVHSPLELAREADLDELAQLGAEMNLEDIGRSLADPDAHRAAVRSRIQQGRVFVVRDGRNIVFTVNLGTRHSLGCQIGGTFVPRAHRGQGWATRGMQGLLARLVKEFPRVTLHVREANAPAVRLYERVGFTIDVPYRLATW